MADEEGSGPKLKPFILAGIRKGQLSEALTTTTTSLQSGGFQVLGTYTPSPTVAIIVISNDAMQKLAARTEFGGYGASLRVALTAIGENVQISYTNPRYWAFACRLEGDNADVATQLQTLIGKEKEFGSAKGLSEKKLRSYHYAFGMEYFNEPETLAKYKTHEEAVAACEKQLEALKQNVTKVYRLNIPGKQEVVFGCGLKSADKYADDMFILSKIDGDELKHSAHMPYEMMVVGVKVQMLHARFRIAISWPDLSMAGDGSFMSIMETPKAINKLLTGAAGGKA